MFTLSNASIQMNTGLKHVYLSLYRRHHVYSRSAVKPKHRRIRYLNYINIEYIIVVKRSIRINRILKTIL